MKDKDGNQLYMKGIHQMVIGEDDLAIFLLKITERSSLHIQFEVYEVQGWEKDPETGEYTMPYKLELYLTGNVGWDGCSHIWFGEEEEGKQNGYLHLCGKKYWDDHVKLMQEIWEFASRNIKEFDKEIAGAAQPKDSENIIEVLGELISAAENVAVKDEDISNISYALDEHDNTYREHKIILVKSGTKHLYRLNKVLAWSNQVYKEAIGENADS